MPLLVSAIKYRDNSKKKSRCGDASALCIDRVCTSEVRRDPFPRFPHTWTRCALYRGSEVLRGAVMTGVNIVRALYPCGISFSDGGRHTRLRNLSDLVSFIVGTYILRLASIRDVFPMIGTR